MNDAYREELDAAHAALKSERDLAAEQAEQILHLQRTLAEKDLAEAKVQPSHWMGWVASVTWVAISCGALMWVLSWYSARESDSTPPEEQSINIMVDHGCLTLDLDKRRVMTNMPLDGHCSKQDKPFSMAGNGVSFSFNPPIQVGKKNVPRTRTAGGTDYQVFTAEELVDLLEKQVKRLEAALETQ